MSEWPDDVRLSAYDGGGRHLSPERAYSHMPEDARLAAAICDAVIWGDPSWAESVVLCVLGEAAATTSSRTEQFFAAHGWTCADDCYDAAHVTAAQRWAFDLHLAGHTSREIGGLMETTALAARQQVSRAGEKLRRLLKPEPREDAQ